LKKELKWTNEEEIGSVSLHPLNPKIFGGCLSYSVNLLVNFNVYS